MRSLDNVVLLRTEPVPPQRATPQRKPNAALRTREHLTPDEVANLIDAAKHSRWGHRNATMILGAYRHALRVSELVNLEWTQVDFAGGRLHVRRLKRGTPSTHPLGPDEMRMLRRLRRESPTSPFIFVSERGAPLSTEGFARLLQRA